MRFLGSTILLVGLICFGDPTVLAHGGNYPGPPGGGTPEYEPDGAPGPGPTPTPGPEDPSPPNSTPTPDDGGSTPNPGGGSTPIRPGARPMVSRSPTSTRPHKKGSGNSRLYDWDWWWDLNDDAYLNLKHKVRKAAAQSTNGDTFLGDEIPLDDVRALTLREIRRQVIPALKIGCNDPYFDARAGAAIALAKVSESGDTEALERLRTMLSDKDKIVRESACIALGILGNKSVVQDLLDIATNSPRGKALSGTETGDVQTRTRAFASVAIGLIGSRDAYSLNDRVIPALLALVSTKTPSADLQMAPAIALQLIKSQEGIPGMIEIFKNPEISGGVRAQIGVALGKVGAKAAISSLLSALDHQDAKIAHSSAIALGLLLTREDKEALARLYRQAESSTDRGTRNFSLIALGMVGDSKGKGLLLKNVQKGQYADATFSAIALGIMGQRFESERADSGSVLLSAYAEAKDMKKAALAIGLGLLNYEPARAAIRADLESEGAQELRGHLCTALGLLNDRNAIPLIQTIVKQKGDPELRKRASIALGLLQDRNAVEVLHGVMKESAASKGVLGAATVALGYIGDKNAVPILAEMVINSKSEFQDVSRAFATVALGFLGDRSDLPLLSRVHEHANYLATCDALNELLSIL